MSLRLPTLLAVAICLLPTLAPTVTAQEVPVVSVTRELDFDEPEAWAAKYYASLGVLTGLGAPREREPGSVELGLEGGWIPGLSAEERTVGFGGVKQEDLNRLSAFGRLRATFGLPGKLAVTLGWVPPVEIRGVEANLVSLALERPLVARKAWGLGLRLIGQAGDIEGDFTCNGDDLRSEPGAAGNEFGCEARSQDVYDLTYLSLEILGSYELAGERSPRLHLGVAANHLDMEFQVDALTFGFRDRTLLLSDGWTLSVTAGADWPLGDRSRLAAELFYSPLDVVRPPATVSRNDSLLNARVLVGFRLR